MAKVARLNVMISANSKGLTAGINSANKKLDSLGKHAASMQSRITASFGPRLTQGLKLAAAGTVTLTAGAVAAAAALGALTKKQIDTIGDTADLASQLGLTFNGLNAVRLAAKLAGISTEKLDGAFEKFSDTTGSALDGNKAAIDSFGRLGITLDKLQAMRPELRFMAVGNAIARIPDPAQRLSAARDFFGKSGGALVNLFEGMNTSIEKASNTLGTFGVNLSALDVNKVQQAGDKIDVLKLAFEGLGSQLAKESSGVITKLADDTERWLSSMGGVENISTKGFDRVADALQRIGDKASYAAAWVESARDGLGILADIADKASAMLPGAKVGNALIKGAARGVYNYGQEDVQRRAGRVHATGKGMFGKGWVQRDGLGTRVRKYVNRANAEQDAAIARDQQDAANAPAVEAAKQRQQADFAAIYNRDFGAEAQARAEAQQQAYTQKYNNAPGRTRSWFERSGRIDPRMYATPGAMMQTGKTRDDEMVMLTRELVRNTGMNTVGYAG